MISLVDLGMFSLQLQSQILPQPCLPAHFKKKQQLQNIWSCPHSVWSGGSGDTAEADWPPLSVARTATWSLQSELTSHEKLLSDSVSPLEAQGVWWTFDSHQDPIFGHFRESVCVHLDYKALWWDWVPVAYRVTALPLITPNVTVHQP